MVFHKENIILFNSFPAYSDNALQLYEYIENERPDIVKKYKIYWAQSSKDRIPVKLKELNFVSKKSLKGVWLFLHAKYVFSTHIYFSDIPSGTNQCQINLWHGCGYKAITKSDKHNFVGDYTLATSNEYKVIQSRELGIPVDHVLVTGLPKDDRLFNSEDVLVKFNIYRQKYKKIYIWMPTYRKAKFAHEEMDGDMNSFGINTMSEEQITQLNTALQENDYMLIVKPHPMDTLVLQRLNTFSNIKCITNKMLGDKDVQLYDLLSNCDTLLSDYSSVIVDYLILKRPITLVFADAESYKNSRGFVFDNIEEYLPGPIVSNYQQLLDYFLNSEEIDQNFEKKRDYLSDLLQKYHDAYSSRRVCDYFFGKKMK